MLWNSFTSNSNPPQPEPWREDMPGKCVRYSDVEYVPYRKFSGAALLVLVVVAFVEVGLHAHRIWFIDLAAWHWQAKAELIEEGVMEGDVVILGTSVLFRGLDPRIVNRQLERHRVTNLALNGMPLAAQVQQFQRYIDRHGCDIVMIELRDPRVIARDWTSGPYFRSWATPGEFMESGFYGADPSLAIGFLSSRVSLAYAYRRGLRNWLISSGRAIELETKYRNRNLASKQMMKTTLGYIPVSAVTPALTREDVPDPALRSFDADPACLHWYEKLIALCEENGVREVVFLCPPSPPFVLRDRRMANYDDALNEFVQQLRRSVADQGFGVNLRIYQPVGYEIEHFTDDRHLSLEGSQRFSHELADWLRSQ